jgi:hypothetical protein
MDVFFSLGKKTAELPFRYGSRINRVVPVGSMFMEYYWFNNRSNEEWLNKKYDVVYIGVNYYKNSKINAYASFEDDYYETFRWLAEFSRKNPHLKVCIAHHADNKTDEKEMAIIRNNPVERIDQELNSYKVAFQSRCAVTFCSTMGYELIAHGMPILFLDPGRRNVEFLSDGLVDKWRVTTYEDFSRRIKGILSGNEIVPTKAEMEDICLDSKNVSERIYYWLLKNG